MPNTIDRARAMLEARLREIESEATSLENALRSLGEGGATATVKPRRKRRRRKATPSAKVPTATSTKASKHPKPAKRVSRAKRTKRAPRGQRADQFLAAVKANPGATASELARAIGISANQANTLAGRLRKKGAVTKRGKGYRLAKKQTAPK